MIRNHVQKMKVGTTDVRNTIRAFADNTQKIIIVFSILSDR